MNKTTTAGANNKNSWGHAVLLFVYLEVDIMVPGKHTLMLVKHIAYQLLAPTKGLLR